MFRFKDQPADPAKPDGRNTSTGPLMAGSAAIADDFWQIEDDAIIRPKDGICYELAIDIFFNARHHVVFDGCRGPDHAHSYRLQVRCRSCCLTAEDQVVIGYQTLRERIRLVASAYNNHNLNDLPPFQRIQSTTENLAAVVYHQLARTLQDLPVELVSVTVWDSPTEAITITQANGAARG